MANLSYVTGTGDNSYVACIIAPAPELEQSQSDFQTPLLRVLANLEPLPSTGVILAVPTGAPQLVASLRDAAGNVPDGVTVTVTMPNGTVLNQPTQPYASGEVVLMQNGSLTDLVIANPAAGNWTIQVQAPTTSDEFQFVISTIPTADVDSTISTTIEGMLHPNAKELLGIESESTWKCWICKVGCYVLAGAISILAGLGATLITAGAAPVGALAIFIGVSVATAVSLVLGLVLAGVTTVTEHICFWAHACSELPTGPTWSGDQHVPGSVMSDSPSAVVFNNQLYCFHQWNDNPLLYYNVLSANGNWSGDHAVPHAEMSDSPSGVAFNGQLYCFYQGGSNNTGKLMYNVLSADGTTWSAAQQISGLTISGGPSAVVFNNQLYCFYQGGGNNGQLWYVTPLSGGSMWYNQQVANTRMSGGPAAVVFNGKLYCFHQGSGNNGQLWYNALSADGTTWAGDQQVPNTNISFNPSAVVFDNQLYCFHQGQNNNGQLWYNVLPPTGTTWVGDRQISGAIMSHGPSAVVFETRVVSGRIYIFHQGQNNNGQLWYDFT